MIRDLKKRVLSHIDLDESTKLHQEMVRTRSVRGEEKEIAELVMRKMAEYGFDRYETYEFAPDRLNVWGMIEGRGEGRRLLLEAHTDTQPVEGWRERWMGTPKEDPFSGALIDGEIWGRGSVDCKAGITASLIACKALREAGIKLKGDLLVSGHGDEEGGILGITRFTERIKNGEIPKADFCIYTDSSDNLHVYLTVQGAIQGKITVRGKGAHSSSPWLGVSAINKMVRVITELLNHSKEEWKRIVHPYAPGPSFSVLGIEGGSFVMGSIPDRCRIRFNRRINPGEDMQNVVHGIETVLRRVGIEEGLDYELEWARGVRGNEVSVEEPGVQILIETVMEIRGTVEHNIVTGAAYTGDQGPLFDVGIPTVYCGPGPLAYCHTTEERIPVDQLVKAAKIYALTAMDFCGAY